MKRELKIGIFAVVVVVIAFFTLNFLRGKDIFDREVELVSGYENVNGLLASAPVYVKGYKAGRVDAIKYSTEDRLFYVTCSVSKDFRIPVDSRMVIYSVDIMGGKGVKIEYGDSEEFAHDGDTLVPVMEMGLMDGLAASVTPLISKFSSTLDSLSVTITGVNMLLSYDNISSVSRTLGNLETTIDNVKDLSSVVNGKSDEINNLIDNLSDLSASLNQIAAKIDTTVSGVNNVVYSLDEADIEGVVSSMKALLDNMNDPEGTVGKLLIDDSIYNSVDSLLSDVNSLVDKIQENPKKYLKISVF